MRGPVGVLAAGVRAVEALASLAGQLVYWLVALRRLAVNGDLVHRVPFLAALQVLCDYNTA